MAPTASPDATGSQPGPDLLIHNCTLSRPATIAIITILSILLLASLSANAFFLFQSNDARHSSSQISGLRKFSFSSASFPSSSSSSPNDEKQQNARSRLRILRAARDTKAIVSSRFANRGVPDMLEAGLGAEEREGRQRRPSSPSLEQSEGPVVPCVPVRALTRGEGGGTRGRSMSSKGEERGLGTVVLRG